MANSWLSSLVSCVNIQIRSVVSNDKQLLAVLTLHHFVNAGSGLKNSKVFHIS